MTASDQQSTLPSRLFSTRLISARPLREVFRTTGQWTVFVAQVFWYLPLTVRRYGPETLRAMNRLAWGRGSIIVDGGVISVLVLLGIALGASIAVEAFAVLNIIGFGALSGVVAGMGSIRELAPLAAGIAFTAQPGARMTAEIGAMRVAEEIDAIEVMGLMPIPFVIGTRLVGGMLCVIPGYTLTLVTQFSVMSAVRIFHNQPGGTFNHYLLQFTTPTDLVYSMIKAVVFCAAATLIHCYFGYFATGGPVGVGRASGRAVRASLVAIMVLDFTLTVALWGLRPNLVFKG